MPAVSIIIPVFNTHEFLRTCLDSVLGQTLRDIEVICVDDGSTDGSTDILREIAARDARVRLVFHAENKGVSAARNAGLAIATGDYVGFVDSDDTISETFYELLYGKCICAGDDIAKGILLDDADALDYQRLYNKKIRTNKFFFFENFTTAIYKREVLKRNNIIFPENVKNTEDIFFLFQSVLFSNNISTEDGAVYYYKCRQGSASRSTYTKRVINDILFVLAGIIDLASFYNVTSSDRDVIFYNVFRVASFYADKCKNIFKEDEKKNFLELLLRYKKIEEWLSSNDTLNDTFERVVYTHSHCIFNHNFDYKKYVEKIFRSAAVCSVVFFIEHYPDDCFNLIKKIDLLGYNVHLFVTDEIFDAVEKETSSFANHILVQNWGEDELTKRGLAVISRMKNSPLRIIGENFGRKVLFSRVFKIIYHLSKIHPKLAVCCSNNQALTICIASYMLSIDAHILIGGHVDAVENIYKFFELLSPAKIYIYCRE